MKIFPLEVKGYRREERKDGLPKKAGIYCVFTCNVTEEDKLSTLKLIYIGESDNIYSRHNEKKHEHYDDFCLYKRKNKADTLCYSYILIEEEDDRKRCEAAMIYKMQPPINLQNTIEFNYPPTHIKLSGKIIDLETDFVVGE